MFSLWHFQLEKIITISFVNREMKNKTLIIFAFFILFVFVPNVHAVEYFEGSASFENVPVEISRHFSSTFDIKLQYDVGPWSFEELVPVIEVTPISAEEYVTIDFDPVTVQKHSVARIPVTLSIDPAIKYEKFFLSISYVGFDANNVQFKSIWNDSLIL